MATNQLVAPVGKQLPDFIQAINNDYRAQVSHVFVLHGNIYDFVDNESANSSIRDILAVSYDDNYSKELTGNKLPKVTANGLVSGNTKDSDKIRIMAYFNISQGLVFPNDNSRELWHQAHVSVLGANLDEDMPGWDRPMNANAFVECMNRWFDVSKRMNQRNSQNIIDGKPLTKELIFTIVVTDADAFVPKGPISERGGDRAPIVAVRNWAKDIFVGHRNRIILMTRHISDINDSIKAELAVSHLVRKPNLEDRRQWLTNFDNLIQGQVKAGSKLKVGNYFATKIDYAEDFSSDMFAIQSAGMNRQQLKDVIMDSWMTQTPIDFIKVSARKQRALEDEYAGMLDFKEPVFGFDQVGGHEHFKRYCRRKIITPLKTGNVKLCSRGVLLTGPPGVGKSVASWALAKEAGLNYLEVDLGKCFGSLVGESEKNIRKLIEGIEAAAPCIVFIDEIDSVLSSGRTSSGDSGTSGRIFNSFMTWMSNPSRAGKVVVIAATNRPDLLDSALIRSGRFDIKIPFLPAGKDDAKGRKEILSALKKKNKLSYDKGLEPTEVDPNNGFGRLLLDTKRYWTGAEIEVLLKEAFDNAYFAERKKKDGTDDTAIKVEDFNMAFESIIPNTEEVERQILLSLLYSDNLGYVPTDYHEMAINKKALKSKLGLDTN
jgi:ATP-dependent 26S proteasome regulatory subunit